MAETSLRVCVRVRPFNARERERGAKPIIRMAGGTTFIANPEDGTERSFTFDASWDSYLPRDDPAYCDQLRVWTEVGEDILNQVRAHSARGRRSSASVGCASDRVGGHAHTRAL